MVLRGHARTKLRAFASKSEQANLTSASDCAALFGGRSRRRDHLFPFRGLLRDDPSEIFGRSLERPRAQSGEALEDLRVRERAVHFGVDPLDRLARRAFR